MWAIDSHPDYDAQGWGFMVDIHFKVPLGLPTGRRLEIYLRALPHMSIS